MNQQIHPQPFAPQPGAPTGYAPHPTMPQAPGPQHPAAPPWQAGAPLPPPAPRRSRTGAVIGAVAGGVVALAGLGVGALVLFGGQTLDTAEAESQISRLTEEQAGLAPTDVRCPADIAVEAGSTFTCTATLDGQSLGFTLRQTDDEGSVDVESDTTFVVLTTVEEMLAQQITDEVGVAVTAGCESEGRSVIVDGIGTPISCTVANAEDPTDVLDVVAQVAADGSVSYESA